MKSFPAALAALALCLGAMHDARADALEGLDARPGFLSTFVDTSDNRVLVELPAPGEDGVMVEMIHAARLTAGLGSNPVGLDRGWGEPGRIVRMRRFGDRVVVEEVNLAYRADPQNPLEARAVAESFATSFIASLPIEDEDEDGGGVVVDLTPFLTSDHLNLVQYLKDREQGSFTVAEDRTFVDTSEVLSFPDNLEVDVFFTLTSTDPGREVATTAASGTDATLVQHHSFVRLPDAGYEPLVSDPRAGAIEQVYYDYSAPLSEPIEVRLARRYRLQTNAEGEVIDPIVFYIDSGAPEPVRSALVDGARWWEEAFEKAGYPGGYRVELLPEDVHPLDVRYNVVQWVHRQTRGWSYGGGVSDPRTGEMLKGHVNLGSLRVRQDRMIFEGLLGADGTGTGAPDDPVELSLARIRQLSAHEVGHALGFAHNFAASSDAKASVMDYPAPDVRLVDGEIDTSNAYGVGVGAWDVFTTDWLYGDHTADERDALIDAAYASGLTYVADRDGRGPGTAHPEGSVWDNGADAVETLNEVMKVRAHALARFGPRVLSDGRPQSDLQAALVPIYLYHRYQTAAAAKVLGGMRFDYGVVGEGERPAEIVAPARQREALAALLDTLDPAALDIPDSALAHLTPRLGSWSFADSDRELFDGEAGPTFDVLGAADTAADLTLDVLLHPERVTRLVEFHRRDADNPSLGEVLEATRRRLLRASGPHRQADIADAVRARYAFKLMELLGSDDVGTGVKPRLQAELAIFEGALDRSRRASDRWVASEIERFRSRPAPAAAPVAKPERLPPGSPIGN